MNQNVVIRKDLKSNSPISLVEGEFPGLRIEVFNRPEQVVENWKVLEKFAQDPFANYAWVKAWYDAHKGLFNSSPVIIVGKDKNNKPQFILPLFCQKIGPFTILLRPGRKHSAYSNGLFSPQCRQMINSENAGEFWNLVFSLVPQADVIAIDGLCEAEILQGNPLGYLPRIKSNSPSYEVLLSPVWENFYKSKTNRKARSNIRRCKKRLMEQGELHFEISKSKEDRLSLLRVLLKQKARQFRTSGTVNPYDTKNVISFYEKLVQSEGGADCQSVVITTLFLDGKSLAVILGVCRGAGFHGLIMSMVDGPLARFSPGRILLHHTLQYLTEMGIRKVDFGVGEARYKEGWVDNEINRYHVLAPLNVKGRLLVFLIKRAAAVKALIKSSGWTVKMMKRARWYSMKS